MVSPSRPRLDGISFSDSNLPNIIEKILNRDSGKEHIHLAAASTIVYAHKNRDFKNMLNSGIVICDSTPAATFLNKKYHKFNAIRGSDLFKRVLSESPASTRHFLLGSSDESLNGIRLKVEKEYPNVCVTGMFAPSFSNDRAQWEKWVEHMGSSNFDLVWVGLGSPKQDYLAELISIKYDVTTVAIGAAMDYFSGVTIEAPKWLRYSHLEWFYRFLKDPVRLWRRYTIDNLIFLKIIFQELIKSEGNKGE